jgi:predicted porin
MSDIRRSRLSAVSAAVILLGCSDAAQPADLVKMVRKAPPAAPKSDTCASIEDFFTTACQLSWYGVRFYGALDVGAGFQSNSTRFAPDSGAGVNYFPGKSSLGGKFLFAPNALSGSNVGVQIKEPLVDGWSFIGQLEAGFNPYSLRFANGVHSIFDERGIPLSQQNAAADSNSQGKFYNNLGFAGVSNDTYGTLTFGRQNTLMQDAILSYDPLAASLGFSALGFFGSWAGGGDTEDKKATTAIKYRVAYANYHFGVFAQVGGYEQGNAEKGAYQGDVGADFKVGPGTLSADVIAGQSKDAVAVAIVGPTDAAGHPVNIFSPGFANAFMSATISDNTSVMVDAKYTVEKLKLYAGWEWVQQKNPSDPFTVLHDGFTDIAGDFVCLQCNLINGTTINSTAFNGGNKIFQIAWFGGTYALLPTLDLTAAYYREWQNDFSGGAKNAARGTCALATTALNSCVGTLDAVSAMLDWRLAAKWDTYIGTLYSRLSGGLNSGFLANDNWSTTGGVRFRW